jgi:hypothetical protein
MLGRGPRRNSTYNGTHLIYIRDPELYPLHKFQQTSRDVTIL